MRKKTRFCKVADKNMQSMQIAVRARNKGIARNRFKLL